MWVQAVFLYRQTKSQTNLSKCLECTFTECRCKSRREIFSTVGAHCWTVYSMEGFWTNEIVHNPVWIMKRMHSLHEEIDTMEALAWI